MQQKLLFINMTTRNSFGKKNLRFLSKNFWTLVHLLRKFSLKKLTLLELVLTTKIKRLKKS